MVSGEVALAPAFGVMICGLPLLPHVGDGATVKVRLSDVSDWQPLLPWATTYQVVTPLATLTESELPVVDPASVSTPSVLTQTS